MRKLKANTPLIRTRIFTLIFLLSLVGFQSKAQKFGIGIAYATSNAFNGELQYLNNNNSLKLGFSLEIADTKGKLVDEQLPNYGRTVDGTGEYFMTLDLGYGRILKDVITIDGEISIGSMNSYINFIDNRFNGGGYHLITERETIAGVGLNAGYIISTNWNVIIGYNTIRKLQFGLRILL
jgi:hypothetical protein